MDIDEKRSRFAIVETQYNSDEEGEINNSNYNPDRHLVFIKNGKKKNIEVLEEVEETQFDQKEINKFRKELEKEKRVLEMWNIVRNYTEENAIHIFDRMSSSQFMKEFYTE